MIFFAFLTQVASQKSAQYARLKQSRNDFEMTKKLLIANKWDDACYHALDNCSCVALPSAYTHSKQAIEEAVEIIFSVLGQIFRHRHPAHKLAKNDNKLLETDLHDDEIIQFYKELSQYNTLLRCASACDDRADAITKKRAQSAIVTLTQSLLIPEKLMKATNPIKLASANKQANVLVKLRQAFKDFSYYRMNLFGSSSTGLFHGHADVDIVIIVPDALTKKLIVRPVT